MELFGTCERRVRRGRGAASPRHDPPGRHRSRDRGVNTAPLAGRGGRPRSSAIEAGGGCPAPPPTTSSWTAAGADRLEGCRPFAVPAALKIRAGVLERWLVAELAGAGPGRGAWPRLVRSGRAVAQRSDGATSSASTSITERCSPSGVVQDRWRSRPTTSARVPLPRLSATFSAWSRDTFTRK